MDHQAASSLRNQCRVRKIILTSMAVYFFPLKPMGKLKLSPRTCFEGYHSSSRRGSGWEGVGHVTESLPMWGCFIYRSPYCMSEISLKGNMTHEKNKVFLWQLRLYQLGTWRRVEGRERMLKLSVGVSLTQKRGQQDPVSPDTHLDKLQVIICGKYYVHRWIPLELPGWRGAS